MELTVVRYNLSSDSTNGMLMKKTSIGYDLESDDEILAIGKFDS